MYSQSIVDIKTFIEGYRAFNHRFEAQHWQHDQLAYTKLLTGWRVMQTMAAHIERHTAADYNVFYVMKNMGASEVKLHSPFLADLLNVKGQHKQGDLFYREFIKLLGLPESKYLPKDTYWFDVQTEAASGTGGIDILITYNSGVEKFAIAIENKIYAGDQERQLERYHEYLVREYGHDFTLVYLTIDGRKPSYFSASREFLSTNSIPCISYRLHIEEMLRNTTPLISPPHVRFIIQQYLQVCQDL
ncbi:hypothetical protein GCM10023185_29110 [Hymenobacter saemangeumensis]|uniref:PD-(D/E)XK nuclease superfamily protein n=1 Tax=Hymenobacter saemangeumensis TaxID=1084522 RepID=A0ABP8ILG4_9BACT